MTNFGNVIWSGGNIDVTTFASPSTITNYGKWEAESDNQIIDAGGVNVATFLNAAKRPLGLSGTFSKTGGVGATIFGILVQNEGTINKNMRAIAFPGGFVNNGGVVNP